jgi:hypothetical protein
VEIMREDGDDVSTGPPPPTHNDAGGVFHASVVQAGSIGKVVVNAKTLSEIDKWTKDLAHGVQKLWQQEEANRRIHDPVALPVRWHQAAPEMTDHWPNIHRVPAGVAAEPLALAGRIEQLAQIYQSIPSGRLVILGQAGAGKTVLASRLAVDRSTRTPARRANRGPRPRPGRRVATSRPPRSCAGAPKPSARPTMWSSSSHMAPQATIPA